METHDQKRDELLGLLTQSYSACYNIVKPPENAPKELAAFCVLDMTQSSYVLTKKNVLWSADSHEYCYIFSTENFTKADYDRFLSFMRTDGLSHIKPGPGHMCSVLSMVILCDSADEDAIKALKRCRLHKSFRLSFYGWMNGRTALAELSTGRIFANMSGHDNIKLLKQLMMHRDTR